METHLKIAGCILIALALLHFFIPRHFRWETELSSLSLITRQILYVHTFFIGFMVFLMGLLCLMYASELLNNAFGDVILFGLFAFWFTRLIFQFFVYSPRLWKGKPFETFIHVLFSAGWIYLSSVFMLCFLQGGN